MSILKSPEQIKVLREGGKILHHIIHTTAQHVKSGVSTFELNQIAEKMIYDHSGIPSFKNYGQPPFPATLCTSVNEEVVHGIPREDKILQDGDIISLDIGMKYPADSSGLYTDMAITVPVGKISKETERLVNVTQKSLRMIEDNLAPGVDWNYIAGQIQNYIETQGFGVVRSLVGHGVGFEVHEEPQLPNYAIPDYKLILKEGMVLAFEPMVTVGNYNVKTADDNWTITTVDNSLSAHFEHTFAITKNGCLVITGK